MSAERTFNMAFVLDQLKSNQKYFEAICGIPHPSTEEKAVKTANTQSETVKLIYIGPNLPKAMLPCNKIFEGTDKEIEEELSFIL